MSPGPQNPPPAPDGRPPQKPLLLLTVGTLTPNFGWELSHRCQREEGGTRLPTAPRNFAVHFQQCMRLLRPHQLVTVVLSLVLTPAAPAVLWLWPLAGSL